MSHHATAMLYYGYPLPDREVSGYRVPNSPPGRYDRSEAKIIVGSAGVEGSTPFVCWRASLVVTDDYGTTRLPLLDLAASVLPGTVDPQIRAFAARYGLLAPGQPMDPEDDPDDATTAGQLGWYLAAHYG